MERQNYLALEHGIPGFSEACRKLHEHQEYKLSKRESEILVLMSREMSVYKIADILCREKTTIYKHVENARAKMKCSSLLSLGLKLSYVLNSYP